jgi:hypothetical protein
MPKGAFYSLARALERVCCFIIQVELPMACGLDFSGCHVPAVGMVAAC